QLPPVDPEFLSSIGFESEAAYRGWVREQMESQLDAELRRGMRRQVAEHLVKTVAIDLPEGLSNRQTDRVVQRRIVELSRNGVPEAEISKHADELRTQAQAQATSDLKLHFILERIAEELSVDVTEEEINAQIAQIARVYN